MSKWRARIAWNKEPDDVNKSFSHNLNFGLFHATLYFKILYITWKPASYIRYNVCCVVTSVSHGLQKTWLQKTSTESRTMALSTKMHEISIIYLFQNLLIVTVKRGNWLILEVFWKFWKYATSHKPSYWM